MTFSMTAHVLVPLAAAVGATALIALTSHSPTRTDSGAREHFAAAFRSRGS
ncbi:hypothetical protein [Nocardia mexicana]|uniref:Uncharacterized protein n=1 Tax=Nocardia mexicana TaxID=279262 RepID=A0A370H3V4_9NOCA|nr:hypothetical protein [Nocardia mexicana]RDI50833.1 hypothetical protein DFR68_105310 [Nocardia mexicana]